MSWFIEYYGPIKEARDPILDAQKKVFNTNPDGVDQAGLAVDAIQAVLSSGAVGGPNNFVRVVAYGHGNPGHVPQDRYVNDTVKIEITQVTPGSDVPELTQPEAAADEDPWEPKDADDFWSHLTEQEQEWAIQAVEAQQEDEEEEEEPDDKSKSAPVAPPASKP